MPDERNYIGGRSSRSMYEQYMGNNQSDNKSRFESKNRFRDGLSAYKLSSQNITAGSSSQWDMKNCAGVPLDYDAIHGTVYVDGSDSHTLLIGATGSKKSRLVVMPTIRILASANENMIVCDPKGEIYCRTAKFLNENGYQVHAINLREPQKGDTWNMLTVPYHLYCNGEVDKAYEFINDMTINLIPIVAKDPYWDYSSRDLLFGLVVLLFKICNETELSEDLVSMQSVLRLKEELFPSSDSDVVQRTKLWKYAKEDDFIRTRLIGTVICPEKTLSCILSTFDQHMSCFSLQPKVVEMLSRSSFDLNKVGFEKTAIFLIMPDEKTTFHKIIAIFLKQMYELLIDNAFKLTADGRFPSRINFVLDEFSSLPTISDFPQMIAASRSRNIRFILIVQSKHQLKQRYGEETDTIMSNCSNWMFLASREIQLLQEISELSGTTGTNYQPLVSMSRLQHLDKEKGECLVFCGRKYPYISLLPDIQIYDGGNPPTLDMQIRGSISSIKVNQGFYTQQVERINDAEKRLLMNENEGTVSFPDVDEDIIRELESKFDELFGPDSNANQDD